LGEQICPRFLSRYFKGLQSLIAIKIEIEPTRIDEELNALAMDFPQMTKDSIF
jgi:hypothetical protein